MLSIRRTLASRRRRTACFCGRTSAAAGRSSCSAVSAMRQDVAMGYVEDARAFAPLTEADPRSRASASARAILWLTLIYWGTNVAIFSLADVLASEPTPLLAT